MTSYSDRQTTWCNGIAIQDKARQGEKSIKKSKILTSIISHNSIVLSLSDFTHPALEMVLLFGPLAGPTRRLTQVSLRIGGAGLKYRGSVSNWELRGKRHSAAQNKRN